VLQNRQAQILLAIILLSEAIHFPSIAPIWQRPLDSSRSTPYRID